MSEQDQATVSCEGCCDDVTNKRQIIYRSRSREDGLHSDILCEKCAALFEKHRIIDEGAWDGILHEEPTRPHLIKDPCLSTNLSFVIIRYTVTNGRAQVWFRGPDGAVWFGVGIEPGSTMVHCVRTKHKYIKIH